ncbi:helix-turn-helix domain-containing protein (plasmid) [Leptospira weilii]|nr:helix-turn-helix domain-containing protein [Leptospira weilii]ULH30929.1 helix-turn-helix domain-containing protein [Leptospira weilii]
MSLAKSWHWRKPNALEGDLCASRKNEVCSSLEARGWSITDLCKEFGISRVTGYKYLSQYELFGIDGLKDKPKTPKSHPKTTKQNVVQLVISARDRHPNWGARKLLASLKGKFPKVKNWPSVSTIGRRKKKNCRLCICSDITFCFGYWRGGRFLVS